MRTRIYVPALGRPSTPTRSARRTIQRTLAGALLLLLVAACGALRRPDPVVDRSRDAEIVAAVRERIAAEPALGAGEIRVAVEGGVVRLHGTVEGLGAWQCALRTAELVPGVQSVVDFLVLERGPQEAQCAAPAAERLVEKGES